MCRDPDGAGCVPKHFCCYGAPEETPKWPVTVAGHQDQTHTVRPGEIQDLPRGIAIADDLRNRSSRESRGPAASQARALSPRQARNGRTPVPASRPHAIPSRRSENDGPGPQPGAQRPVNARRDPPAREVFPNGAITTSMAFQRSVLRLRPATTQFLLCPEPIFFRRAALKTTGFPIGIG